MKGIDMTETNPALVTNRDELLAVLPGTLMTCRHGHPMTRTPVGEYAAFVDLGTGLRWRFFGVEEITGELFDEESKWFPITITP